MKPYTYLIGWSEKDLWYYGVRFGTAADPDKFWVEYFTSSRKVKQLRKELGEPDVIEIRKVFNSPEAARLWETRVIRKMKMVISDRWLNQTDNTGKFFWQGPRSTMTQEHKEKLSAAHRGKTISPEHAKKLHEGRRRSKNSPEHIEAYRQSHLGKKRSEETKQKMREAKLNDPGLRARCSLGGKISAEKRKTKYEEVLVNGD